MRAMLLSPNLRDLVNENMLDGLAKITGTPFTTRKAKRPGTNLSRTTKVSREMRSLECRGMMSAALLREKPYKMPSDISLTDTRVLCLGGRHFGARFE